MLNRSFRSGTLLCFALFSALISKGQGGIIQTQSGTISGAFDASSGIYSFKGIPFAAPPLGNLRWREPQPVKPWSGVLKCDQFRASAMQMTPNPNPPWSAEFMAPLKPISEDCLYLNVWTSKNEPGKKKPVIVWIHGGAFTGGSGSVALYDGTAMAQQGVVFVTINYRLGIFGFLAHPELSAESPHHVSGNYGIFDQIAALQWVKDNIAAFGGDSENVTIDGQSAGSTAVNTLVASPLGKGLFKRAIAESGFGFDVNQFPTLAEAEQDGLKEMAAKGAKTLVEMRKIPADEFVKQYRPSEPVMDGYLLPEQIEKIFEKKEENPVDILLGYNEGDGYVERILTAEQFKKQIHQQYDKIKEFGSMTDSLLAAYPANTDEEAKKSQKRLFRDLVFGGQAFIWALQQSSIGKNKAWIYYFDHSPPDEPVFGAFHSAEFGYALHNLYLWNKNFDAWDMKLSDVMNAYWVNFATTGDPNGLGLPKWPKFSVDKPEIINFGDQVKSEILPGSPYFIINLR